MLFLHDENDINVNALTSIKVFMDTVNDKLTTKKENHTFKLSLFILLEVHNIGTPRTLLYSDYLFTKTQSFWFYSNHSL